MLSMVYFHRKTIKNAANITANFKYSQTYIFKAFVTSNRMAQKYGVLLNIFWHNTIFLEVVA